MNKPLSHRGPDGEGIWTDPDVGLVLAHRRLAIIDLSGNGAQPMESRCGRYVITFNGEIYNFVDLRDELLMADPAFKLKGRSDTEVLLAAIAFWGIRKAILRCNGMFAFALWDRRDRIMTLARDRLGEKPLYFSLDHKRLLFASELSAIRASGLLSAEIDMRAFGDYLRLGYILAPRSIWKGASKLPAGCVLTVAVDETGLLRESAPVAYWSLIDIAREQSEFRRPASRAQIDEEFEAILQSAVRLRNFADVPIGAFLSGGLDSSTVVAALKSVSDQPLRTFTAGFESKLFDERAEASAVANYLGTQHHDFLVRSNEFFGLVTQLPRIYDEPFSDPSQIASCLVCRFARTQVAVCFSGDGGDELFAGYSRYRTHAHLWRINRALRFSLGRHASSVIESLAAKATHSFDGLFRSTLHHFAPGVDSVGPALARIAKLTRSDSRKELYQNMISTWISPESAFTGITREVIDAFSAGGVEMDGLDYMSLVDQLIYLSDNNLTKMDRASMQCSLEVRVPLLDHRLVEFSWRLRPKDKLSGGRGKLPIRRYLAHHLPAEVLARPKRGFGVPIAAWLRGELKSWAADLLFSRLSRGAEHFDQKQIARLWSLHQSGQFDFSTELWTVVMFLNWLSVEPTMPAFA